MPRRFLPSPAMVVAVIALFATLGGGAYAATASQGRPAPMTKAKVKKIVVAYFKSHRGMLIGSPGANGVAGIPGAAGSDGPGGAPGPAGPVTAMAPSGLTQTGVVAVDAQEPGTEDATASISFPLRLASAPVVDQIAYGGPDAHCQGSHAAPTATPGYLCIYLIAASDAGTFPGDDYFYPQEASNANFGASPFGVLLTARPEEPGRLSVWASWAVTAP